MSTTRQWQRWLHGAIIVVGLAIAVWGMVLVSSGKVTCRGVEMQPGDVCTKSSFTDLTTSQTQSYEQRKQAMRQSQPTVIGVGLLLAAFGGFMLVRSGRPAVTADEERLLREH